MVDSGVNHQAAAKLDGCQLCKPVAPAAPGAPPMPLRLPEFGYRTTAPARGSTRRWTRPFSTSNASERHEACPASNTGQRHNPLPSQALRIFAPTICPDEDPARAGQPDDHAEPAGPARRAECLNLDGHGLGRHTAGARPERSLGVRTTSGPPRPGQGSVNWRLASPSCMFIHDRVQLEAHYFAAPSVG